MDHLKLSNTVNLLYSNIKEKYNVYANYDYTSVFKVAYFKKYTKVIIVIVVLRSEIMGDNMYLNFLNL